MSGGSHTQPAQSTDAHHLWSMACSSKINTNLRSSQKGISAKSVNDCTWNPPSCSFFNPTKGVKTNSRPHKNKNMKAICRSYMITNRLCQLSKVLHHFCTICFGEDGTIYNTYTLELNEDLGLISERTQLACTDHLLRRSRRADRLLGSWAA